MVTLIDNTKAINITIREWDEENGYGPDWSADFFDVGNLKTCFADDCMEPAYIVDNVDYCIEQAYDMVNGEGDFSEPHPEQSVFVNLNRISKLEHKMTSKLEHKMTSNDFTKTRTYADLYHYWESEDYELDGINRELNYIQPIDRDQAVDDEGHAVYDEYVFYKIDECKPDRGNSFTAEQIEQFARTW